jgi:hypothetical protein
MIPTCSSGFGAEQALAFCCRLGQAKALISKGGDQGRHTSNLRPCSLFDTQEHTGGGMLTEVLNMTVAIITGSAGLIGSEAVGYFGALGMDVVGIDNGMRGEFFGQEASTNRVRNRLCAEVPSYEHPDEDVRGTCPQSVPSNSRIRAVSRQIIPRDGFAHAKSPQPTEGARRSDLPHSSRFLVPRDSFFGKLRSPDEEYWR